MITKPCDSGEAAVAECDLRNESIPFEKQNKWNILSGFHP
jgi:hypothetical protein